MPRTERRGAGILQVSLLAAACTAALAPGHLAAEQTTPAEVCAELAGPMRASCLESAEILMSGPEAPDAALSVRVTADRGVLTFSYSAVGRTGGLGSAQETCEVPALVLPAESRIRVTATSIDTVYTWRVPDLGIAVDLVPGRINELTIEGKAPGRFAGRLEDGAGRAIGAAGLRFADERAGGDGTIDVAALCEQAGRGER